MVYIVTTFWVLLCEWIHCNDIICKLLVRDCHIFIVRILLKNKLMKIGKMSFLPLFGSLWSPPMEQQPATQLDDFYKWLLQSCWYKLNSLLACFQWGFITQLVVSRRSWFESCWSLRIYFWAFFANCLFKVASQLWRSLSLPINFEVIQGPTTSWKETFKFHNMALSFGKESEHCNEPQVLAPYEGK